MLYLITLYAKKIAQKYHIFVIIAVFNGLHRHFRTFQCIHHQIGKKVVANCIWKKARPAVEVDICPCHSLQLTMGPIIFLTFSACF